MCILQYRTVACPMWIGYIHRQYDVTVDGFDLLSLQQHERKIGLDLHAIHDESMETLWPFFKCVYRLIRMFRHVSLVKR